MQPKMVPAGHSGFNENPDILVPSYCELSSQETVSIPRRGVPGVLGLCLLPQLAGPCLSPRPSEAPATACHMPFCHAEPSENTRCVNAGSPPNRGLRQYGRFALRYAFIPFAPVGAQPTGSPGSRTTRQTGWAMRHAAGGGAPTPSVCATGRVVKGKGICLPQ